ncbi:hypothetical protein NDU88_005195 [Pleurodeles waltl]|uniref:Uncharacterized protein n=1 Tax=Pleurodeles waltl TaxID=8319 RepID=A0AAV7PHV5_PLEWA|nr:hypothetical protein NDU88_005195 [Pleurodeles waltl]
MSRPVVCVRPFTVLLPGGICIAYCAFLRQLRFRMALYSVQGAPERGPPSVPQTPGLAAAPRRSPLSPWIQHQVATTPGNPRTPSGGHPAGPQGFLCYLLFRSVRCSPHQLVSVNPEPLLAAPQAL